MSEVIVRSKIANSALSVGINDTKRKHQVLIENHRIVTSSKYTIDGLTDVTADIDCYPGCVYYHKVRTNAVSLFYWVVRHKA